MKLSIDHIDWNLEGYKQNGESLIDTIKRLGLPYENFVVEIDYEEDAPFDEDDMEQIDMLAQDAAYDYIADKCGEEYADCIDGVGWSFYE